MADIGAITGIVGMLTGIGGLIMGYLGYRQSGRNKVLDLRLQLRREINELRALLDPLPGMMEHAKQSHTNVLAAMGLGRSGEQQAFSQDFEVDKAAVANLAAEVSTWDGNHSLLSDKEIEPLLGEVNRVSLKASRYAAKYRGVLASDDLRKSEIRAEHVAMAAARIQIPLKNKLGE